MYMGAFPFLSCRVRMLQTWQIYVFSLSSKRIRSFFLHKRTLFRNMNICAISWGFYLKLLAVERFSVSVISDETMYCDIWLFVEQLSEIESKQWTDLSIVWLHEKYKRMKENKNFNFLDFLVYSDKLYHYISRQFKDNCLFFLKYINDIFLLIMIPISYGSISFFVDIKK